MKKCAKCGVPIEYGVNGCMLMDICFSCNGGYPQYPPATKRGLIENDEYFDYIESLCVDNGEE